MARATWKGVLQISRVAIPIKVFPATESGEALSFNQLHRDCQTRLTTKKWCAKCEREVPNAEIVKGFEFEKGRYVILSDDDFEKVKPASTRIIDLVQFAEIAAIDPMYFDRTYYLAPDGTGGEAFAVMREAMTGKVGVGKLALYGREYLVAVRPRGTDLLLHTLHHDAEIRSTEGIEELATRHVVAVPQLRLARQLIAAFDGPLNLSDFQDDYRAGLRGLIDAKIAGNEIVTPAIETPAVMNLRDALTQSLTAVSARKKRPAKATMPAASKRHASRRS